MICLTGDLHHMSLKTGNQAHCDKTEIRVARDYLDLLESRNIKVTFFVTGKCFVEEWPDLAPICRHPLVEIGGHTWSGFTPSLWHRACNKLLGNYNGPRWYQRWDTRRTIAAIQAKTGRRPRCWRHHMYMHGPHTEQVLARCGIDICSDGVMRASNGPVPHPAGILNFPLNVMPDHEHLYHAERTPESVERFNRREHWSDDYGSESYYIGEWTDRVMAELTEHEENGILSNIIIHPITMYLCDRFQSVNCILDFIAQCKTIHMSELLPAEEGRE